MSQSGLSRGTQPMRCREMQRRATTGADSRGPGGQAVHHWPSTSWRSWEAGVGVQAESEAWEPGALMSEGRRWTSLFYSDWMVPTTMERVPFFTQSTDSNAPLFQKHPHSHAQRERFTNCLGVHRSCQVDTLN